MGGRVRARAPAAQRLSRGVSDWYGVWDAACPISTREGGAGRNQTERAREVLQRPVSAGARARCGDLFVFEFGNVERPAWEECREAC